MAYPKNKEETYQIDGGVNTKISKYSTQKNEVLNLVNMNFEVLDALTKRPGSSLYLGATVSGRIGGVYEYERLNGSSFVVVTANTNAYNVTGSFTPFKTGLLNGGIFDFVTFVDRLFMANGQDFFKYDGSNADAFSLPPGISSSAFSITAGFTSGAGLSGVYVAGYGYLNSRGYFGPVSDGITVSLNGISYNSIFYTGMTTPSGFGVTALSLYRSEAGFPTMNGTTNIPANTATFLDFSALSNREQPDYIQFTLAPKYLEIFNNQLMLAGFSSALSTLYWSDIGEPEGVRVESFAEVRTNDGDKITGVRAYLNDLIVTKERSIHKLSGDNPDNFTLQQVTDQYGCLSDRTMVVYNNVLLFLDSKGVIRYNGANVEVLSTRVEDYMLRMNVNAARENAVAVHSRLSNEIWFAFPIDSSQVNNFVLVYDYVADAFYFYEGFIPSTLAVVKGSLAQKSVMYGGYTGTLAFFDEAIESDLGQGFTCLIQTRYTSLMGQSTEQQFRRFYLNIDPVLGITQGIGIKFFTDYGATVMATYTIYQAPFQSRVDFGLPAKTLSTEIAHFSPSLSFRTYGWTLESRFQRSV